LRILKMKLFKNLNKCNESNKYLKLSVDIKRRWSNRQRDKFIIIAKMLLPSYEDILKKCLTNMTLREETKGKKYFDYRNIYPLIPIIVSYLE
jgi:hypothetical protein